jgi:hypothetical protein
MVDDDGLNVPPCLKIHLCFLSLFSKHYIYICFKKPVPSHNLSIDSQIHTYVFDGLVCKNDLL